MSSPVASEFTARLGPQSQGREDLVARVCGALRSRIQDGKVTPGTRLPSETELSKAMGVSRPTLREATRILSQEGLLDIRHGVGTFVAARTPHVTNSLDSMVSLSASIRAAGGEPHVHSLTIEQIAAPSEVAEALGLAPKADVVRIRRVRLMNERPLGLAFEYLPIAAPIDLPSMQRFDGGSLYGFLIKTLGLDLLRSEMAVTAVSANARQSQLLSVKPGAPLLLMRELHYGAANRRLLYSVNYHNSAVVELTLVRAGVRT
ncbi:MAG TPA: GntR family transcriptional regulator [Roseiarcus sp.]|jgi:DNA-binding GntR family transcriptional regulator